MSLLPENFKISFARPKTKIQMGKWTAVIMAAAALLRILIPFLSPRDNLADLLVMHALVSNSLLSNFLDILLYAAFLITLTKKLLKPTILLFFYLVFLVLWNFFAAARPPLYQTVLQSATAFFLLQGLLGVYRQTFMKVD